MDSTLLAPQADTRFDPGALMREWHVRLDKPDNADALNQQRLLRLLPLLDARGQEDVADVIYALVRELAGMNASAAKDPLSPMVFPDQAGDWEAVGVGGCPRFRQWGHQPLRPSWRVGRIPGV